MVYLFNAGAEEWLHAMDIKTVFSPEIVKSRVRAFRQGNHSINYIKIGKFLVQGNRYMPYISGTPGGGMVLEIVHGRGKKYLCCRGILISKRQRIAMDLNRKLSGASQRNKDERQQQHLQNTIWEIFHAYTSIWRMELVEPKSSAS